jgi:hypothetical protein
MKRVKFVGSDVHAETIAIAIAEQDGEVRSLGVIPNREDSLRKLVRELRTMEELWFCFEASPTCYVLYWQLTRMGAKCEVVAPTLVPVKALGSREDGPAGCVKTGEKLSGRRVDGGMGAGRGARDVARSGSSPRIGQEGSTSSPASVE